MKNLIKLLTRNTGIVRWTSYILSGLSVLLLLMWALKASIETYFAIVFTIDLEACVAIVSALLVLLSQLQRKLLDEAEYSPAHALASGYVNNFIAPVITQLIEDGVSKPKLCIFRPENFDDLSSDSVDRVKARLVNKNYDLSEINLKLKHGRARDILTLNKKSKVHRYFDFPNTLLSLYAYVDYKLGSDPNTNAAAQKKEFIGNLIEQFYLEVEDLLKVKGIEKYVEYCDKALTRL